MDCELKWNSLSTQNSRILSSPQLRQAGNFILKRNQPITIQSWVVLEDLKSNFFAGVNG